MKYRKLGDSAIAVSEVGFGVWTVSTGWWGEVDETKAVRLLRLALDLGMTFFDTADTYGNGYGEEVLAKALGGRRHEIVISTKFGYDFYSHGDQRRGQRELPQNFDPGFVRFALEQSLRRLGTDYIDFYQLHNARMDAIERDDLFAFLEDMLSQGKIRAYGVALGPAIGWKEEGLAAMRLRRIAGLQIIYNMLEQDPGRAFFPVAAERGVGLLVRVPHSSGLLEGKYTLETSFPPTDHRSHRPREWLVEGLKKLEKLGFLTEGRDMTIGQAAIKFILAQPTVSSVLPNIYDEAQLREFAEAPEKPDLTEADLAAIQDLYEHNFYLQEETPAQVL